MRFDPKLHSYWSKEFLIGLAMELLRAYHQVVRYIIDKRKVCPELMEPYDWWNYDAPVFPPPSVKERARETGRSVDWQNVFWTGTYAAAIFYRTRHFTPDEDGYEFITHVLPGSYVVSKTGWLHRFRNLEEPEAD